MSENLNEVVSQPAEMQAEKMVPQETVNNLIREAQARAYEKARQEAPQSQPNQVPQPAAAPGFDRDEMRKMMAEEADNHYSRIQETQKKQLEEQQANALAQEFIGKLQAGSDKYEDFDQVIGDIGLGNFPQLVAMSNQFDNVPDIMYELGKNPSKIGSIMALAYTNPKLDMKEMRRLSESIKNNDSAKAQYKATPNPLMGMKPTVKSGDNGGKMTISELRRHPSFKA